VMKECDAIHLYYKQRGTYLYSHATNALVSLGIVRKESIAMESAHLPMNTSKLGLTVLDTEISQRSTLTTQLCLVSTLFNN